MSRSVTKTRKTDETDISVEINLDGTGKFTINTGLGFFDHMLQALSKHSLIDMKVSCKGDLNIDEHHTIEDVAITLGQAINEALGDKRGIERYGFLLPMDEALAEAAIDLGGRAYLNWKVEFNRDMCGDVPTEMFEHFFHSLADNMKANIYIHLREGRNTHHQAEAIFKAFARALRFAVSQDPRNKELMPSTKGSL